MPGAMKLNLGELKTGDVIGRACHCMGPQNGEPLCPCSMRGVIVRDGRYIVPERDLGPVGPAASDPAHRQAFSPFRRSIWDGV